MGIERINARFLALKKAGRTGLVTFTMAGDPSPGTSLDILMALPGAGADIVEWGMPFSDPVADGPVIQQAGLRAIRAGMNLPRMLDNVKQFRAMHPDTPLILMGYYNPVFHYGAERFIADATQAGADGTILVDLPPEEGEEPIFAAAREAGFAMIRLVAPTTQGKRLEAMAAQASGFIYYVSIAGITGAAAADPREIGAAVQTIKSVCRLPVVTGFGIKTAGQAHALKSHTDAVVVGSAIVSTIAAGGGAEQVASQVRDLAKGLA